MSNGDTGTNTNTDTATQAATALNTAQTALLEFADLMGWARASHLHQLDAGDVTTGVFDQARIPNIDPKKAGVRAITQVQYDALVSGDTVDDNTLYIITG